MLRRLIAIILLWPLALLAAQDESVTYTGRPVAAVIDELRAAGHPFAYSTSIVSNELVVTAEPVATEPVALLLEILAAHELTLHYEAGVHLVVRMQKSAVTPGRILLLIRNGENNAAVENARLTIVPALSNTDELSTGVFQFFKVTPGRYQFIVEAEGFQTTNRILDLGPGDSEVVNLKLDAAKPEIETITISASRYEISRDISSSRFLLDQRSIQNMPDTGEDPLRISHRLPGAAASGASARTHFRGGDDGEIGVMLNGQWLFDPFHVRDYQSVFSAIDARAISGVEVYTGGFPAQYGDRMSGLVLMESMEIVEDRHSEIGLSVFNTSFLTSGTEPGKRWLFSARRGNLDLVINSKFGEPSFYDVFGEVEFDLSPNASLSMNALYANDRVRLILESDPSELEQIDSNTRNAQFWMQLQNQWSASLSSSTLLSILAYENLRSGFTDDIEKIVSSVRDDRQIDQVTLRQDWTWQPNDHHLLRWGIEAGFSDATYEYAGTAEFFELQSLYANGPEVINRSLSAAPQGGNFALYVSDRWRLTPRTMLEWGLRWDDQTYTNLSSDAQISPRFNILYALTPQTELRLTWGRYQQSQPIQQLQIEDGVDEFWPAQRSDHVIAGIRHLFRDQYALRMEIFFKDMSRITPRFENLYNPLGPIPELQPDRVRLDPDSAQSAGVELSVDRSGEEWNWWASYTLSEVTDRINGIDYARSWDQRHAFQGGVSWKSQNWSAAIAASVHSGWPTTDLVLGENGVDGNGDTIYVVTPGPRNALRHSTFASLDMRLSRTFELRRGSLMAFVEISNAFDRRNPCCIDWDAERDIDGNLFLERGQDYWLPFLPAIGVLWEF
ncbi:MAG: TonB-dependent receptor [Woeseiaceae bacterium]